MKCKKLAIFYRLRKDPEKIYENCTFKHTLDIVALKRLSGNKFL